MSFDKSSSSYSHNKTGASFGGKPGGYGGKPGFKSQPVAKTPANLPKDYLQNGYKDDANGYEVEYITTIAQNIGSQLADTNSSGNTASSKVRAYFDIVESVHSQFATKKITANSVMISLATLKARVNNVYSKGNASKLFKDFIDKNVDQVIKSPVSELAFNLTGFKLHFEAVLCYMH